MDGSPVARSYDDAVNGPLRHKMWTPSAYAGLDAGIRFPVKVLHAVGIDTNQSCEGGDGHAYPYPSIDIDGAPLDLFHALTALESYGLHVRSLNHHWRVQDGLIADVFGRIELCVAYSERADEWPHFVWHYRSVAFDATEPPPQPQWHRSSSRAASAVPNQ